MVRHLVIGSFAAFAVSFVSLVLLARWFPLEFISDVKAVTVYGGWFSVFFSWQVHSAYLYFHGKGGPQSQAARVFTLGYFAVATAACATSFFFLFPTLYPASKLDSSGLAAFSATVGLNLLYNVSPALFAAEGATRQLRVFLALYPLAGLVSLVLAYAFRWGITQYAWSYAALSFVVVASSEWRRHAVFAVWHIRELVRSIRLEFLTYSTKMSASVVVEALAARVDKVLAARFLAEAAFAKYSVLCFENPIVNLLLASYGVSLVKTHQAGIRGNEAAFLEAWSKIVRVVTFLTFPVSVFLLMNHEWFIATIFGARFMSAGEVFQAYLLVTLVRYAPFQAVLRVQGAVHYNVRMAVGFLVAAGAFGLLAVRNELGPGALAYSLLAGWIVFNALAVFFATRVSGLSAKAVVLPGIWLARIAQCAAAGLVARTVAGENIYGNLVTFGVAYSVLVIQFDCYIRQVAFGYWRRAWSLA